MSVVIRLRRAGTRKRPFYHMVVADSRMRRDGRFIETVGYYNPMTRPEVIEFAEERIADWVRKGARPSETVDQLMKRKKKGVASVSQKDRKRGAKATAERAAVPAGAAAAGSAPEAGEAAPGGAEQE